MIYKKIERTKYTSLLKLLTMGVGVASSLILFYIVINEFNTDSFYKDKKQIYQVFVDYKSPDWNSTGTHLMQPFVPALLNNFSEIETGTVVFNSGNADFEYNKNNIEAEVIYADSLYFTVFKRPFLAKTSDDILSATNTAVVSQSFAAKNFGNSNLAVSKIIKLNGTRPIEIVGVIEDWPANSSQTAEIIISFSTLKAENRLYMGWGGGDSFQGYIKLNKNVSSKSIESRLPNFVKKYVDVEEEEANGMFTKYFFISISEAGFRSNPFEKTIVFMMLFVGLLILALVCFNTLLINLSTYNRVQKDISIRRVLGATAFDLQKSVFYESLFYLISTILIASFFLRLTSPLVSEFYGFHFFDVLFKLSYIWIVLLVLAILFVVNIIVQSSWIIRFFSNNNSLVRGSINNYFQKTLLILQIGIALSLLIFLYFIHAQLSYANNFDKGYSSDNLIYVELKNEQLYKNHQILKSEISKLKNIESVCLSDGVITQGLGGNGFYDNPEGKDLKIFRQMSVDEDFFKTLGIELEGENYTKTGEDRYLIVNKEVGKIINATNPIGKYLYRGAVGIEIKAVIPNFIAGSVHTKVEPTVFFKYYQPSVYSTLSIRLSQNKLSSSIEEIQETINKIVPEQTVNVKFYNNDIEENYKFDRAVEKVIGFFALLAVLITLLGLIGFSINMVNKRTKEIGIRKINGATTGSILIYLNKRFLLNIVVALILFIPLTYYLVTFWLQNYAYAVNINPWVFVVASLLITVLVLLVVSFATYRYANRNPIKSLKYE